MDPRNTSRRGFLKLAGVAGLSVSAVSTLAACGGGTQPTAPGGGGSAAGGGATAAGAASYWFLSGQPQQGIREATVKRFNTANPDASIKYTEFQNDAYKTKIKTAIGAGQGPTIIWGW
ncbi:MAG: twin-arginine translocation signal domain-containing protein, partial [Janthinobacterium lividum]